MYEGHEIDGFDSQVALNLTLQASISMGLNPLCKRCLNLAS